MVCVGGNPSPQPSRGARATHHRRMDSPDDEDGYVATDPGETEISLLKLQLILFFFSLNRRWISLEIGLFYDSLDIDHIYFLYTHVYKSNSVNTMKQVVLTDTR